MMKKKKGHEFIKLLNPRFPQTFEGRVAQVKPVDGEYTHDVMFESGYEMIYRRTDRQEYAQTHLEGIGLVRVKATVFEFVSIRQKLRGRKHNRRDRRLSLTEEVSTFI